MTGIDTLTNTRTLAQRLAEGRIPAPDALRFAMQLAEALRKIHEEGLVHGPVSPAAISLNNNVAELMPAASAPGDATPYIAPEVLAGNQPDRRSDIFSLGAVVYEMLTGQPAFEGASRSKPAPSGSPAVDRFVESCLASDPNARLQSVKRVMMELKLLHAAARWAESPAASRWVSEAVVRAEMQQMEARVAASLQSQEKIVTEVQHAITGAVAALHEQLAAVGDELQSSRDRANQSIEAATERIVTHVQNSMDAISERIANVEPSLAATSGRVHLAEENIAEAAARIEGLAQTHQAVASRLETVEQNLWPLAPRIDALEQKALAAPDLQLWAGLQQGVTATGERVSRLEEALELAHQRIAVLEQQPIAGLQQTVNTLGDRVSNFAQGLENAAQDMQAVQKTLQEQSCSIESTRVSLAQADDLLERVVEALESLQAIVLDQFADRAAPKP